MSKKESPFKKGAIEKAKPLVELKEVFSPPTESAAQQPVEAPQQAPEVPFDAWWAHRSKELNPRHMKEIIWADFKARGLAKMAKPEEYEAALKKYGI